MGVNLEISLSVAAMLLFCHLHLGGNFFFGQILPEYGTWQHLQYLALFGNELAGYITSELGNLFALCELYIDYYNTPELQNLDTLFLHVNVLSGSLTPELGSLKSMNLSTTCSPMRFRQVLRS
ncbi:Leucine-rich repeat receptor-like serine/threonine-protein kinase BAM1 [Glycine max]|nr:Leucine-rich repeat receptor-like serine/threonine-protein kinase BAM1 [Glycine max]